MSDHAIRILYVEDHADTAVTLARLMRLQGHEVRVAGSVARAIELANEHSFDLLVCDIGLPDGNGCEIMQNLISRGSSIKGIALTGYGMVDDVRHSYDAGFVEHLTKPIYMERLEVAIRSVINGGNGGTAIPPTSAEMRQSSVGMSKSI